jgi:hypothetical protein
LISATPSARLRSSVRPRNQQVMAFDLLPKTDLGPVGVALIDRLHDIFGKPAGTVLQAYADVVAAKIHAVGDPEAEALRKRTVERIASEEIRNQTNMEATWGKTALMLEPGIDPRNVEELDEDWLYLHSLGARKVSDEDMQTLWARILAEEVKEPGSFSKRTLRFLETLDKTDAEMFTTLCRYTVEITHTKFRFPVVLQDDDDTFVGQSRFTQLSHLLAIGLIQQEELTMFGINWGAEQIDMGYFSESHRFDVARVVPTRLPSGFSVRQLPMTRVFFTQIGSELNRICQPEPFTDFWHRITAPWARRGIVVIR